MCPTLARRGGTYLSLNRTCAATSRHGVDRIFLELPLFQNRLPKMRFQQEHFLGVRVRWARFLLLPSQPAFGRRSSGCRVYSLVIGCFRAIGLGLFCPRPMSPL